MSFFVPVGIFLKFSYFIPLSVSGLPFWYLPPANPFILHSNSKSMTRASDAITKEVLDSGGRMTLALPRDRPEQNLSLLAFFGHKM